MVKKNSAFAAEDMIGIFIVIAVVLLVVFFLKKQPERRNIPNRKELFQEQESETRIRVKEKLKLSMHISFGEGEAREYLKFWYRVTNVGQEEVFLDQEIVGGENLFFEAIDPNGNKSFLPRKLGAFQKKEFLDVRGKSSLAPGEFVNGFLKLYHDDYLDYASGLYTMRAHLAVDTSLSKNRNRKRQDKLVSDPYDFYIPGDS